jgi:hypothetical protein
MRKMLSLKRFHRVRDLDNRAIAAKLESAMSEEAFHNEQEFSYMSQIVGCLSLGEVSVIP